MAWSWLMSMKIEPSEKPGKTDWTRETQIKEEMELDIERLEPINERKCWLTSEFESGLRLLYCNRQPHSQCYTFPKTVNLKVIILWVDSFQSANKSSKHLIGRITDEGVVPNLDLAIEYPTVLNVREILDVRKIKTTGDMCQSVDRS
jgi:hypothetical protein